MAAGLNVINGLHTTRFYPPNMKIPGSMDVSAQSPANPRTAAMEMNGGTGSDGSLPALWWLGIIIVLVAVRLTYEFT